MFCQLWRNGFQSKGEFMKYDIRKLPNRKITVAPSILAADFGNLERDIRNVAKAGADLLHLDVMDGHFVPNLTIGPPVVKAIRKHGALPFDTHLMIAEPSKYIAVFADSGADHITIHLEIEESLEQVIAAIRAAGCTAGISIKPATPAEALFPYLKHVDLVLVMTVEPGFGGQSFMAGQIPKIRAIREEIKRRSLAVHLEVDGGINGKTAQEVAAAGANMIVAGTSVFGNPNGLAAGVAAIRAASACMPAL